VIAVTRLNGIKFYINAELIQMVEETPDTVITLINGKKVIVRESAEIITERFIDYQRSVRGPFSHPQPGA